MFDDLIQKYVGPDGLPTDRNYPEPKASPTVKKNHSQDIVSKVRGLQPGNSVNPKEDPSFSKSFDANYGVILIHDTPDFKDVFDMHGNHLPELSINKGQQIILNDPKNQSILYNEAPIEQWVPNKPSLKPEMEFIGPTEQPLNVFSKENIPNYYEAIGDKGTARNLKQTNNDFNITQRDLREKEKQRQRDELQKSYDLFYKANNDKSFLKNIDSDITGQPQPLGLKTADEWDNTIPGIVGNRGTQVIKGAINSTADMMEGLKTWGELSGVLRHNSDIRNTVKSLTNSMKEYSGDLKVNESDKDSWTSATWEGIGSTLPMIVTSALTGGGYFGSMLAGGLMGAGTQFNEAMQMTGGDTQKSFEALVHGTGIGMMEGLVFGRILGRIQKLTSGSFSKWLTSIGLGYGENALDEGAQNFLSNYSAKKLYDKDRDLGEGVWQSMTIGGAIGVLFAGLGGLPRTIGQKTRQFKALSQHNKVDIRNIEQSIMPQNVQKSLGDLKQKNINIKGDKVEYTDKGIYADMREGSETQGQYILKDIITEVDQDPKSMTFGQEVRVLVDKETGWSLVNDVTTKEKTIISEQTAGADINPHTMTHEIEDVLKDDPIYQQLLEYYSTDEHLAEVYPGGPTNPYEISVEQIRKEYGSNASKEAVTQVLGNLMTNRTIVESEFSNKLLNKLKTKILSYKDSANYSHKNLLHLMTNKLMDSKLPENIKKIRDTVSDKLSDKPKNDYSSTQFNIPQEHTKPILDYTNSIPEKDLYREPNSAYDDYGRETEPHITALYGLHTEDPGQVQNLIKDYGDVTVKLGKTSLFQNDKYDVLKVDVKSPELHKLNKHLSENVEYTNDYDKYEPHLTIAYLKSGEGKKYVNDTRFEGKEIKLSELLFSDKQSQKTSLPLTDTNFQFAGKTAKGFNTAFQEGKTFEGRYDGKERFEIDDSKAKLDEGKVWTFLNKGMGEDPIYLKDILQHDELYSNYPDAKDVRIFFKNLGGSIRASYEERWNRITLNTQLYTDDVLSPLLHEIQHYIQGVEGFPRGTNLEKMSRERMYDRMRMNGEHSELTKKMIKAMRKIIKDPNNQSLKNAYKELTEKRYQLEADFKAKHPNNNIQDDFRKYQMSAGEIEARDTQARMELTPEQRDPNNDQYVPPYSSENISKDLATLNYQYAGKKAQGFSTAFMKGQTFKNPYDKMDRFEIDDSKAKLKPLPDNILLQGALKLEDILDHQELYDNYPGARDITIKLGEKGKSEYKAYYYQPTNTIGINTDFDNPEFISNLLHEVQHYIQHFENFAKGGNADTFRYEQRFRDKGFSTLSGLKNAIKKAEIKKDKAVAKWFEEYSKKPEQRSVTKSELQQLRWDATKAEKEYLEISSDNVDNKKAFKDYKRLAGEIEARDTQARMNLTADQRNPMSDNYVAPYSSENIASQNAIVRFQLASNNNVNTFYSPAQRIIENSPTAKYNAKDFIGWLRNQPGFKPAELEWVGLEAFLEDKKQVTKQELVDYMESNKVEIKVIDKSTTGANADTSFIEDESNWTYADVGDGHWKIKFNDINYTIDASAEEGYFTILLNDEHLEDITYDDKSAIFTYALDYIITDPALMSDEDFMHYNRDNLVLPGEKTNYREILITLPETEIFHEDPNLITKYNEAISEEQNYISHKALVLRLSLSVPGNYDKVAKKLKSDSMFKYLRKNKEKYEKLLTAQNEKRNSLNIYETDHFSGTKNIMAHLRTNTRIDVDDRKVLFIEEIQSDWNKDARLSGVKGFGVNQENAVPDFPFRNRWQELAIKKAIQLAVEEDLDAIAFINGEQTDKRYDLSSKVSMIQYNSSTNELITHIKDTQSTNTQTVKPEELPKHLGNELSEKLLKTKGSFKDGPPVHHMLKGLDIKLGGEWAYNLYDKQVPNIVKDYAKKLKGKVQPIEISIKPGPNELGTFEEVQFAPLDPDHTEIVQRKQPETPVITPSTSQQFGMLITPELKSKVKAVGLPMFQLAVPQTETKQFKEFYKDSKVRDDNGKPIPLYTGHSNTILYDRYDPKQSIAGAIYATESPQIASSYAEGKFGDFRSFENGRQYKLKNKKGQYKTTLNNYKLSDEQKAKIDSWVKLQNDTDGELGYNFADMVYELKHNQKFDKNVRKWAMTGGIYNLRNIWEFNEEAGNNLAYDKDGDGPRYTRQTTSQTTDVLTALGIDFVDVTYDQPAVMKVWFSIKNPIYADQPFPADLLKALKEASKGERVQQRGFMDDQWQKTMSLKEWISRIESGDEFWSTTIPSKALPIIKKFGYDGIREVGQKGTNIPRSERQYNWIAFDAPQMKSATGNNGNFDVNDDRINYQLSGFQTRNGHPIGFNYDTDFVARERFDISKLKKLGAGSDRVVYELEPGKVLKVAKTARGLDQNIYEGDYYLSGIIPEVFEKGLNYVVAEKVESTKNLTKKNPEYVKLLDMLNEINKFSQSEFDRKTDAIQSALNKVGFEEIMDYNVIWLDFIALRNWGIKDGEPIHLDGGTFGGVELLDRFRGKKNLSDPDFREIYDKSKEAKKKYGDTDSNTMFQLASHFNNALTLSSLNDKTFKEMEGKQVSHEAIKQKLKQQFVKKIDRDIILDILEQPEYKSKKRFDYDEFKAYAGTMIVPLTVYDSGTYADYGMASLSPSTTDSFKDATTRIFNFPEIEHGILGHFSNDYLSETERIDGYELIQSETQPETWLAKKRNSGEIRTEAEAQRNIGTVGSHDEVVRWIENYNLKSDDYERRINRNRGLFGHTRVWTGQDGSYNVVEVQSDYYQKNDALDFVVDEIKRSDFDYIPEYDKMDEAFKKVKNFLENKLNTKDYKVEYNIVPYPYVKITQRTTQMERLSKLHAFETEQQARKYLEDYHRENGRGSDPSITLFNDMTMDHINIYYPYANIGEPHYFIVSGAGMLNSQFTVYEQTSAFDWNEQLTRDNILNAKSYAQEGDHKLFILYEKSRGILDSQEHIELSKNFTSFIKSLNEEVNALKHSIVDQYATIEQKQFVASAKYYRQRMIRESVRDAYLQGAPNVRIAMPETLAVIEGFIRKINTNNDYEVVLSKNVYHQEAPLQIGDVIEISGIEHVVIVADEFEIKVLRSDQLSLNEQLRNMTYDFDSMLNFIKSINPDFIHNEGVSLMTEFRDMISASSFKHSRHDPIELIKKFVADISHEGQEIKSNNEEIWNENYVYVNNSIFEFEMDDNYGGINQLSMNPLIVSATDGDTQNMVTFPQINQPNPDKTSFEDQIDNLPPSQKNVIYQQDQLIKDFKKERPDMIVVEDQNGFKWADSEITEADGKDAVVAFQLSQQQTPEFKNWFKKSDAVNTDGTPRTLYHGTINNFSQFRTPSWFSVDTEDARQYAERQEALAKAVDLSTPFSDKISLGQNIIPVYLSIQNPLNLLIENHNGDPLNISKHMVSSEFFKLLPENLRSLITPEVFLDIRNEVKADRHIYELFDSKTLQSKIREAGYDGIKAMESNYVNYMILDENQVKSSLGNNGDFSKDNKDINFQLASAEIVGGFYSPIENKLLNEKAVNLSANKWRERLGKGDEMIYTGLSELLDTYKPNDQIKKQEILNFIKDNRLEIYQTDLTDDLTQYSDSAFQLKGNKKNYVEILVRYKPRERNPGAFDEIAKLTKKRNSVLETIYNNSVDKHGISDISKTFTSEYTKAKEEYDDLTLEIDKLKKQLTSTNYKGLHFSQYNNTLLHLRTNIRTDSEGRKVLFIEEIQSDWGQRGRKFGFNSKQTFAQFQEEMKLKYHVENDYDAVSKMTQAEIDKYLDIKAKSVANIPDAPFVTDTNAWLKLAWKVIFQKAVAENAEVVSWTTGEQQNKRYPDESRNPNAFPKFYGDIAGNDIGSIGKIAESLLGKGTIKVNHIQQAETQGTVTIDDTNYSFDNDLDPTYYLHSNENQYQPIYYTASNNIDTKLPIHEQLVKLYNAELIQDKGEPQFSVELTPEKKSEIQKNGQPMFQITGFVHGTGKFFTQYDDNFIGKDGLKGFGHYFTNTRSVADEYKEMRAMIYSFTDEETGQKIADVLDGDNNKFTEKEKAIIREANKFDSFDQYIKDLNRKLSQVDISASTKTKIKNNLKIAEDLNSKAKISKFIFEVIIHKGKKPSQYDMNIFEKQVSKRIKEKVISQLKKEKNYDPEGFLETKFANNEKINGEELYRALLKPSYNGNYANPKEIHKNASRFLLRAGIDGNIYNISPTTTNMVVFSAEHIYIDKVTPEINNFQLTSPQFIVDAKGDPLVVYYGTHNGDYSLTNPDINFQLTHTKVYRGGKQTGDHIWVSEDKEFAEEYGEITEYYMPNDLEFITAGGDSWDELVEEFDEQVDPEEMMYNPSNEFIEFLKSEEYDAFENGENILIFNKNILKKSTDESNFQLAPQVNLFQYSEKTHKFYQTYLDQFHSVKVVVDKLKEYGVQLKPTENPYYKLRMFLMITTIAEDWINNTPSRINESGQVEYFGESLQTIVKNEALRNLYKFNGVPQEDILGKKGMGMRMTMKDLQKNPLKLLSLYMNRKSVLERIKLGQTHLFTQSEAEFTIDAIEKQYPQLIDIYDRIRQYNSNLLDLQVDLLGQDTIDHLKELHPDYASLKRSFDKTDADKLGDEDHFLPTKLFNKQNSPVKTSEGSDKYLYNDPMEDLIESTYLMIETAYKNDATKSVSETLAKIKQENPEFQYEMIYNGNDYDYTKYDYKIDKKDPLPYLYHEIKILKERLDKLINQQKTQQNYDFLNEKIINLNTELKRKEEQVKQNKPTDQQKYIIQNNARIVDKLRAEQTHKRNYINRNKNIIHYKVDGVSYAVEVHPDIVESIHHIKPSERGGIFYKILKEANTLVRNLTALSPSFIARNLVLDQWTANVNEQQIPFYTMYVGWKNIIFNTAEYKAFKSVGGQGANFITIDQKFKEYKAKQMVDPSYIRQLKLMANPLNWIKLPLQTIGNFVESGTRVGTFANLKLRGVTDVEAGYRTREVTTDFNRKGTSHALTVINDIGIPFFNARLQGTDRLIRTFEDAIKTKDAHKISKVLASTLPIVALTLFCKLYNDDDDEYLARPQVEKDLYWHLPKALTGTDNFVMIPKGDVGYYFGSMIERMFDGGQSKDYIKNFLIAISPTGDLTTLPINPLLKMPVELVGNYQFFQDGKNVYTENSSSLYGNLTNTDDLNKFPTPQDLPEVIGQSLGINPKVASYIFRNLTVGFGLDVMGTIEMLTGNKSNTPLGNMPVAKRFISSPNSAGLDTYREFKTKFAEIESVFNTAMHLSGDEKVKYLAKDNNQLMYDSYHTNSVLMKKLKATYSKSDEQERTSLLKEQGSFESPQATKDLIKQLSQDQIGTPIYLKDSDFTIGKLSIEKVIQRYNNYASGSPQEKREIIQFFRDLAKDDKYKSQGIFLNE